MRIKIRKDSIFVWRETDFLKNVMMSIFECVFSSTQTYREGRVIFYKKLRFGIAYLLNFCCCNWRETGFCWALYVCVCVYVYMLCVFWLAEKGLRVVV